MGPDLDTAPGQDGAGTLAERLGRRLSERLSAVRQRIGPEADRLRTRLAAFAEAAARHWETLSDRVRQELIARKLLREPGAESPLPSAAPDAQAARSNRVCAQGAVGIGIMFRLARAA